MEIKKRKKAQTAVIGLLFGFLLIAVFAIILQPLLLFIEIGVNATGNATHAALINTIIEILPVFMALVVLIAVVALITGRQA